MSEFSNYSIALVGLGPHAKRIYINLFNKYKITPKLIIDLKSKQKEILEFLEEKAFRNVELYLIDDKNKDELELTSQDKKNLRERLIAKEVKYAIISTEPKAHFAYAKFFLENNINILMDKPITAPMEVSSNTKKAMKIEEEYNVLCDLYKRKKGNIVFKIQCQRRFHEGYIYVKKLLEETVKQYNIPITYIDIYHNDGTWNMPSEFIEKENHPYKYRIRKAIS